MLKKLMLSAGLLLVLTGCSYIGDPVYTDDTYEFDDVSRLSLDLSITDVVMNQYDGDVLSLHFKSYENGPELSVKEGSSFRIKEVNDWPFTFGLADRVELTLDIPYDFEGDITIDHSSGGVDITSMDFKDLTIDLSSGDVYLEDVHLQDAEFDISSGDITLEDVVADSYDISISSGDTEIYDITGDIKGHASSGSVYIETDRLTGDIDYGISSGDFELSFTSDRADGEYDLGVSSGDVSLDFPLDDSRHMDDDKVIGTIGDGNYKVDVHISSGDIEIH